MRSPDVDAIKAADERLGRKALKILVAPFYLQLMGFQAIHADEDLLTKVGRCSRRVTDDQVRLMLRGTWRPLSLGAWYAIARDDDALTAPVHDALETCLGQLTSPALITATLFYPCERTLHLLMDYAATDRQNGWGAADLADAAAQQLTEAGDRPADAADQEARRDLNALLQRGAALRRLHASRQ